MQLYFGNERSKLKMEQGKRAESKHDGDHGLQQTTNIHFNPDKKNICKTEKYGKC